jgi:hypothetical protein
MKEKKYTGYGYHGGGRKRGQEEVKDCTLAFSCTKSEKARIKKDAESAGLSVSKYITEKLCN